MFKRRKKTPPPPPPVPPESEQLTRLREQLHKVIADAERRVDALIERCAALEGK